MEEPGFISAHFLFDKGQNPDAYVDLFNVSSDKEEILSADAIKFGGEWVISPEKPAEAGSQTNVPSSSSIRLKQ